MRQRNLILGAVYDAGASGTETFRWYILREIGDPTIELATGRRLGTPTAMQLDFGPVKVVTTAEDLAARQAKEGHSLEHRLCVQCDGCGLISLARDPPHRCHLAGDPAYHPEGWT